MVKFRSQRKPASKKYKQIHSNLLKSCFDKDKKAVDERERTYVTDRTKWTG